MKIIPISIGALFGALSISPVAISPAQVRQPGSSEPPRLVVMLVADQMRADYVTLYGYQWTKGLRRLLDTGAVFPMAAYPYTYTVTCPGHATIATGTFPATHGAIGNEWYDREEGKTVACTTGPEWAVPFGGRPASERHGPSRLKVPTFADQLRGQASIPPTVVTLSLKARSAIMLAGQPSDSTYAIWEEGNGTWTTSTAYTSAPWPVVEAFVTDHPISEDYGQVWTRALPSSAYLFTDWARGELAPAEFPHSLNSRSETPDERFGALWRRSPMSDRYLGRLGEHMVRELKMGQRAGTTDVLGIGFSALDIVGHEYGPRSHEVQDVLARLDETVGALFDTLDQLVGPDRYIVGFSADHGVAAVPEQNNEIGDGTGRHSSTALRTAIEHAIESFLGAGPHFVNRTGPNVYLAPGVLARLMAMPGARNGVTRALEAIPGISGIFWADELGSSAPTDDPFLRAARLSYVSDRSGDFMVIFGRHWMAQSTGTTHGSPHEYDQRVPLWFAGAGVKPGRYRVAATPADFAPTLARLAGFTMANVTGQVLTAAIK